MGTGQRKGSTKSNEGVVKGVTAASRSGKNEPAKVLHNICFYRLVPSRYLCVFWDERRLGIRLRRAGNNSSLPMKTRARLNLIPNLLSPPKTHK